MTTSKRDYARVIAFGAFGFSIIYFGDYLLDVLSGLTDYCC